MVVVVRRTETSIYVHINRTKRERVARCSDVFLSALWAAACHSAGNSSKATTGIAAPGCELQKAEGIADTGADLVSVEPIAKDMVEKGAKDVDWLLNLAGCKDEMLSCSFGQSLFRFGNTFFLPVQSFILPLAT